MSALKANALASQDGPAWQSALAGFDAGAGTIDQRRAFWDLAQEVQADPRARNDVKGSARAAFTVLVDPANVNYRPRP